MADNVETVRRLETAWATNDYDTVRAILSPDFPNLNHGAGAEAMPPGGVDGIIQGHEMTLVAFPDRRQEILDSFGDGDRVVIRSRMTGTNEGGLPWFGIPANGNNVDIEYITIYRLEGDKVVESWGQMDVAKMMQQLGVGGQS
jgi:predicted ester cyclase